jgi:Pregnancy-associated plasma protein-A
MSPAPRRRQCGAMQEYQRLLESSASFRRAQQRAEAFTARVIASGEVDRVMRKVINVPVVAHVVYRTPDENVSKQQIDSQINVINKDYRGANSDKSKVPAPWKGLFSDAKINFHLARRNPQGRPTDGVTRTKTTRRSFGPGDDVKRPPKGGAAAWPADGYLNLWVCKLEGGLLGYAQFPGGPAATDGVVIQHSALGTTGTVQTPFDKGRTATHEVGHWLNLFHIWGDTLDCSGGDNCTDTPNAEGPNYGKPTFPHVTCTNGPNGDMFMNYMDYTDDDSMYMFTAGQVARMNATLAGPRKKLAGL